MSLFKQAAARGVAHELVRRGFIAFPSKEAADEAADAVADNMGMLGGPPEEAMPDISGPNGHPPEDYAAIANQLIELAEALMAQAPEQKVAAYMLHKTASSMDLDAAAYDAALSCMEKAAGALIEGGDKGNDLAQAGQTNEVAKLDDKQRPEGTYAVSNGDTALDTSKGEIGHLGASTAPPTETPAGGNSVTEDAKTAALRAHIRKMASALIQGGDKGNTPEQAAQTNEVAKLDQAQRPEGKYKVEQGGANFSEPQAARVGLESTVPVSTTPSGTNSVIEASKTSEEDAAFLTLFKKCAADVGPFLPAQLSEEEKVAAISTMIGFDRDGRQAFLDGLYRKTAAVKEEPTENAVTEALEALRKDEAEKKAAESPLLAEIRRIAAAPKA